ncbi:hypothetical protein V8G54_029043 [Vigna mungo]|uniref:Uncharacterized protein n=1 Tax=Vigna mungo TaxID=3915 RepID=A0AAQ3MTD9_VIGMU
MADSGNNNEDSGLVSGGALLVVFCLQVEDEDAREMVAPRRRFGERLAFMSVDVDDELARSGAIRDFVGCYGGLATRRKLTVLQRWWMEKISLLVVSMEALQICISGGDDEYANLACGIREVEDEGGFAQWSWRLH